MHFQVRLTSCEFPRELRAPVPSGTKKATGAGRLLLRSSKRPAPVAFLVPLKNKWGTELSILRGSDFNYHVGSGDRQTLDALSRTSFRGSIAPFLSLRLQPLAVGQGLAFGQNFKRLLKLLVKDKERSLPSSTAVSVFLSRGLEREFFSPRNRYKFKFLRYFRRFAAVFGLRAPSKSLTHLATKKKVSTYNRYLIFAYFISKSRISLGSHFPLALAQWNSLAGLDLLFLQALGFSHANRRNVLGRWLDYFGHHVLYALQGSTEISVGGGHRQAPLKLRLLPSSAMAVQTLGAVPSMATLYARIHRVFLRKRCHLKYFPL